MRAKQNNNNAKKHFRGYKNPFSKGTPEYSAFEKTGSKYQDGHLVGSEQGQIHFKRQLRKEITKDAIKCLLQLPFSSNKAPTPSHEQKPVNRTKNRSYTSTSSKVVPHALLEPNLIKYQHTILDDLRDHRSSKIISSISDGFAKFFVAVAGSTKMTDTQANLLRGAIAFVTSEVLNKMLKTPIKTIEQIEMFVKVGKVIYKFIVWYNHTMQMYELKENSIKETSKDSYDYIEFLYNNPRISCEFSKD